MKFKTRNVYNSSNVLLESWIERVRCSDCNAYSINKGDEHGFCTVFRTNMLKDNFCSSYNKRK